MNTDMTVMGRFDTKTIVMAGLAIAITVLTGTLGVVFAQTQQVERVALAATEQAQAGHALRLIESMDSRAQGALITVAAYNAGLTGEQERTDAINAVAQAERAIAISPNPLFQGRLAAELSTFIGLLESGDTTASRRQLDASVDDAAEAVRSRANAASQAAATVIEVETGVAGNWGLVTSFGVGLLAPLLALATFRTFVNRRRKQDILEQDLLRIRELGQAKDEMIANLSHELRTPLTGLYGFALALEDMGYDDPKMTAEMNGYIIRDAADLSRMVEDLLVAAKAANDGLYFQPETVSIVREIEEALVPFRWSDKTFIKKVDDETVFVDRLRVRHILRNLISNAEKHGGTTITLLGKVEGDRYRLEIIDNGPGVSEGLSARLFERFVHDGDAPLTKGSVGVGLSVAQALAVGMDCRVTHEQRLDETVFIIDMPHAVGSDPAPLPEWDDQELTTFVKSVNAPTLPAAPGPARTTPLRSRVPDNDHSNAPAPRPGKTCALLSAPPPADPFANRIRTQASR
ncbi:MAG: hypothetical protein JJE47_09675 [Acidimicrobiia bacterium]|nr:hypothetical protein [Acidimicrobiia bacterium]